MGTGVPRGRESAWACCCGVRARGGLNASGAEALRGATNAPWPARRGVGLGPGMRTTVWVNGVGNGVGANVGNGVGANVCGTSVGAL